MTITLDDSLRARLNGMNETIDVRDETGKVVGYFLPDDVYRRLIYAWANAEFDKDPDGLRRAREDYKAEGGLTTAEAIAYVQEIVKNHEKAL